MRIYEFQDNYIGPVGYHGSDNNNICILKTPYSSLVDDAVVYGEILFDVAVAMSKHWSDYDFEFGRTISKDDTGTRFYEMTELESGKFEEFFTSPTYIHITSRWISS